MFLVGQRFRVGNRCDVGRDFSADNQRLFAS
jgi:hypothetical protein